MNKAKVISNCLTDLRKRVSSTTFKSKAAITLDVLDVLDVLDYKDAEGEKLMRFRVEARPETDRRRFYRASETSAPH